MTSNPPKRKSRAGGAALEFALILPVLVAIITGTMDYGWYFFQESLVINALREAIRIGSYQSPVDGEAPGACAACSAKTAAVAVAELTSLGFSVTTAQVTPTMESVGDTCAIVLQPAISHVRLIGLVPTPSSYNIRLVGYAQNVSGC